MSKKLTSMKITKAERKAREEKYSKPIELGGDVYPYGLTVRLDQQALEKLGIKSLPKTGRKVRLEAVCSVTSTRDEKRAGPGGANHDRNMELQIEDLAVHLEATSAEEAVDDALKDS